MMAAVSEASAFGTHLLAVVTNGLLRVAREQGLDPSGLLESSGLTLEGIQNPDAYVPIERHIALGRAIVKQLGNVNAGLQSGAAIYGDPRGALGFAIRRSGRHERAIERFCRFISVTNECARLSTARSTEGLRLCVEMVEPLAALGHPTEALFAAWVSTSRHATGTAWAPLEVCFRHAAWGDEAEHREFFGCPVKFGAEQSCLLIDASTAQLPIPVSSHPLEGFLENLQTALSRTEPVARRGAVDALCGALRAGGLDTFQAFDLALLSRAARLFIADAQNVPAFEAAFLLGFPNFRDFSALLSDPR